MSKSLPYVVGISVAIFALVLFSALTSSTPAVIPEFSESDLDTVPDAAPVVLQPSSISVDTNPESHPAYSTQNPVDVNSRIAQSIRDNPLIPDISAVAATMIPGNIKTYHFVRGSHQVVTEILHLDESDVGSGLHIIWSPISESRTKAYTNEYTKEWTELQITAPSPDSRGELTIRTAGQIVHTTGYGGVYSNQESVTLPFYSPGDYTLELTGDYLDASLAYHV